MAKVMGSNKATADKAPLIYICPVCGKKYIIVMQNMFPCVNYKRMIQLQMKHVKLMMAALFLHLN